MGGGDILLNKSICLWCFKSFYVKSRRGINSMDIRYLWRFVLFWPQPLTSNIPTDQFVGKLFEWIMNIPFGYIRYSYGLNACVPTHKCLKENLVCVNLPWKGIKSDKCCKGHSIWDRLFHCFPFSIKLKIRIGNLDIVKYLWCFDF